MVASSTSIAFALDGEVQLERRWSRSNPATSPPEDDVTGSYCKRRHLPALVICTDTMAPLDDAR
jgi:hypothetical protein